MSPRVLAGVLTTIVVVLSADASRSGVPLDPSEAVHDPATPAEMRLAAMLSVHAHAFWPDGRFPQDIHPISLNRAVTFLLADDDALAGSRRRRAIALLAAYGRGNERVRRELARLLEGTGKTLAMLDDAIQQHFQVTILNLNPVLVEPFVADYFVALSPECPWERLQTGPKDPNDPVLPQGNSATISSQIWVPRDVDAIARALDPQSWDVCGTLFGPLPPEHTFLIKVDIALDPVKDSAGQYDPGPLRVGSEYQTNTHLRLLFEHFTCQVPGCLGTWFKNLLHVATAFDWPPVGTVSPGCPNVIPKNKRFVTTYSLNETLEGEIAGVSQKITVNQGFLWAQTDAKGVGVNACMQKTLELDNKAAQGGLEAAIEAAELAGQFAELACCLVPATDVILPDVPRMMPPVVRPRRFSRWGWRTR